MPAEASSENQLVVNPFRNKRKGGNIHDPIEISSDEEPPHKISRNTVAKRTFNPAKEGFPTHRNANPKVGYCKESSTIEQANLVDALFKVTFN